MPARGRGADQAEEPVEEVPARRRGADQAEDPVEPAQNMKPMKVNPAIQVNNSFPTDRSQKKGRKERLKDNIFSKILIQIAKDKSDQKV